MKKSYEHNLRKSFPNRFGRRVREVALFGKGNFPHLASVFTYWIFRLQSAEDLRRSEFQVFFRHFLQGHRLLTSQAMWNVLSFNIGWAWFVWISAILMSPSPLGDTSFPQSPHLPLWMRRSLYKNRWWSTDPETSFLLLVPINFPQQGVLRFPQSPHRFCSCRRGPAS